MSLFDRPYMRNGGRPADNGMNMIWTLIAINVIAYLFIAPPESPGFLRLALTSGGIRDFHLYQLVTAGFLHGSFSHIFFNMWGVYLFGTLVAPHIGGKRFLALYLAGAITGNLLFLLFNWNTPAILCGASGAVCAIMMAAAMLEPNRRFVMIFMPFFPLKTATLVICYTILEIILEMTGGQSGIAHLAYLGGFLGGYCFLKALFGSSLPWDPFRHRVRPGEWKRPPAWGDAARPSAEPPPAGGPVSPRELDALLDKISREGINSLSEHELARLRQAREEMRGGRG